MIEFNEITCIINVHISIFQNICRLPILFFCKNPSLNNYNYALWNLSPNKQNNVDTSL